MEAEERPAKLRKLSHDETQLEIPSPLSAPNGQDPASATSETLNTPTDSKTISKPRDDILSADAAADTTLTSGLPIPDTTQDPSTNPSTTAGLSKSALKKIKRKTEWEAGREDRKAKRRDRAKNKKARRRAERDEAQANTGQNENGDQDDNDASNGTKPQSSNPPPKQKWQRRPRVRLPISFILDCSFDKLMTEREVISLGSQLTRCYSDNSKARYASHFYISSWTPESELRKRFDVLMKGTYRNWKGIEFLEEDFVSAGNAAHAAMTGRLAGKMAGVFEKYADVTPTTTNPTPNETEQSNIPPTTDPQPKPSPPTPSAPSLQHNAAIPSTTPRLIYLTSDSPHTLTTLAPHTTYIIGGLVDKNRHKSLCYNTAVARGIPTAKLPLAQYMKMTSREVLATNHVVEIMLRWLEVGDWGEAFLGVLPKRKGAVLKGEGKDGDGNEDKGGFTREDGGSDDDDDDDDDEDGVNDASNGNGNGNGDGHESTSDLDIDINVSP